jgi:hypothetical protein
MGFLHKGMSRRRLKSEGTPADAEILDIRFTNTSDTHGPIAAVKLAVRSPAGRVFEVDAKINASIPNPPQVGQVIPIRYDPEHPSTLIWDQERGELEHQQAVDARRQAAFGAQRVGPAEATSTEPAALLNHAEVINTSGADPSTALEKLARARDQGLITDEQLEMAKRRVEDIVANPVAAQSSDVAERLQRLDQLRQQRLVTDDEYAAARREILGPSS